jgi:hydroxypyruvate isomerase
MGAGVVPDDTSPGLDNAPPPSLGSVEDLTTQQILDIDIENLAVKIDKHHCQTKKAVLVSRIRSCA